MKKLNPFHLAIAATGLILLVVLRPDFNRDVSFYGFAESKETEINYNYSVVVDRILVKPGQSVSAGDVILNLSRRKSKETLADQQFKMAKLRAEAELWRQEMRNEIESRKADFRKDLAEADAGIKATSEEIAYKKSLLEQLVTVDAKQSGFQPLKDRLDRQQSEREELVKAHESRIAGLERELSIGQTPFDEELRMLEADLAFDESQKHIPIEVKAPADGLVGTISCKEEEHIPAYRTLLTFYEPHSSLVKGFVHEDLRLEVQEGDGFSVSSLQNPSIGYEGVVIGLGSRVVEIPARLRKIPAVKSYGREVLIEIPEDNSFLQKEKVSIKLSSDHN